MIIFKNISLRRGGKLLLEAADTTIQPGQHIALIGANGSGKSSLLSVLLGELTLDGGEVAGVGGMRIAHMAQEVVASGESAADYVLAGDSELATIVRELRLAQQQEDYSRAATLHAKLDEAGGYDAESRVERLLAGLGFSAGDGGRAVSDFSGGWRIRLNLAQALMTPSELLLLDEPTNHLDLDATLWLQQWLAAYPGTLLMISHDRDFIDGSCSRVLQIEQRRLNSYKGSYSDFERQRAERLANEQALFEKQQQRMRQIEGFVARFRYKASKARQAQSRLKELERMQLTAPAHLDSPFGFQFPQPERASDPLLRLDQAELGYGDTPVLNQVNLQLRPGSRYGLLGRNGSGKSTLLKSLVGKLPLIKGDRELGKNCQIGYFDQQQLEALDLDASPLVQLQRVRPDAREQEILNFLGGFDFRDDNATGDIHHFSGGEKARLALALVVWQQPNLLILDEPTNHLDLEMRHALEVALQDYEGAVMVVSHDRHLLRNSADELLLVHDGKISEYDHDLAHYEAWSLAQKNTSPVESDPSAPIASRKDQRRQAAAERERLRPIRRAIEKLEAEMETLGKQLTDVEDRLADSALYEDSAKDELTALLKQQGNLKEQLATVEEEWLAQQELLEQGG